MLICSKIIVYSIICSDFVQAVLAVTSLFLLCTLGDKNVLFHCIQILASGIKLAKQGLLIIHVKLMTLTGPTCFTGTEAF